MGVRETHCWNEIDILFHSSVNIAKHIMQVVSEYDMTPKVLSITLDNASAISKLTPYLSLHIGFDIVSGDVSASASTYASTITYGLLHQRCACHIIDLIVKSGLKCTKTYLEDFRTTICFLNSSNQRIAAFKSVCTASRVCI